MPRLLAAVVAFLPLASAADEGMWTYDGFPAARVKQALGVEVTPAWLAHVQASTARLAGGCSASFVSARGLVLTNHHCARGCVEQLSSAGRDLVQGGFLAKAEAEELRCPAMEVNQLLSIADVTEAVKQATAGLTGKAYADAQRAELARLEQACQKDASLRCDVVSLYRGGRYALHTYRRFQDVRLVWAPEHLAAHFGGDPDNFSFPRYSLDAAFLRVYDGGRPAAMKDWLRWSATGTREGSPVFVAGNPGSTSRQLTVAQLEHLRDVALPERLLQLAETRGLLTEYRQRGPEQHRHAANALYSVENSYKALLGRRQALVDRAFFRSVVEAEARLKAEVAADPALAAEVLPAFDAVAAAVERRRALRWREQYVAGAAGFDSALFDLARTLVRGAEERAKPNGERLREFQEAGLPALSQRLFSPAPIYAELETFKMTHALVKLRERLGADDPFVRQVLGQASPAELARQLVERTTLADPAVRRALWEGGAAAVAASTDPLVELARRIDPEARAVRRQVEEEVEPAIKKGGEAIAQARFALRGTSVYPDATFSPRLSYGRVRGWAEGERTVAPFTTLGGAFERATGREPFELAPSWLAARAGLDPATPFNLCTDNDIIGGNSGSPLLDARGEVVGLVFDGNLHSLGGDYGFDERLNRAVAVDARGILEALRKVYRADRLVKELTGGR
jgi:peptidase S46-like protein